MSVSYTHLDVYKRQNQTHTQEQKDLRAIFGAGNAKWFDKFGINYFTREVYDGFYPGYGDSWPTSQLSLIHI